MLDNSAEWYCLAHCRTITTVWLVQTKRKSAGIIGGLGSGHKDSSPLCGVHGRGSLATIRNHNIEQSSKELNVKNLIASALSKWRIYVFTLDYSWWCLRPAAVHIWTCIWTNSKLCDYSVCGTLLFCNTENRFFNGDDNQRERIECDHVAQINAESYKFVYVLLAHGYITLLLETMFFSELVLIARSPVGDHGEVETSVASCSNDPEGRIHARFIPIIKHHERVLYQYFSSLPPELLDCRALLDSGGSACRYVADSMQICLNFSDYDLIR